MTSSDPVSLGTHAMLGLTLGILLILVIRAGVMRLFGPPIAYVLTAVAASDAELFSWVNPISWALSTLAVDWELVR